MRWLNAREWLEHERLTGLPHADFASAALSDLDEQDGAAEALDQIEDILGDHGRDTDQEVRRLVDLQDAVLVVLADAGVITHDQGPADVDVPGLLRMFLPAA